MKKMQRSCNFYWDSEDRCCSIVAKSLQETG